MVLPLTFLIFVRIFVEGPIAIHFVEQVVVTDRLFDPFGPFIWQLEVVGDLNLFFLLPPLPSFNIEPIFFIVLEV